MEGSRKRIKFVRCLIISTILILLIIFNEFVYTFYNTQAPKILVTVNYFLDLIYQYQDDISRLIFKSILPDTYYSEVNHTDLIHRVRLIFMRLFLHLQITKWLGVAFGITRKFWVFKLLPRLRFMIRDRAQSQSPNPDSVVSARPTCKCRLFPKEFHWLLFNKDLATNLKAKREPNETHQSIMKLFDVTKNQPSYQIDLKTFDEFQTSFREESLANDEYTGWSEEILGRISSTVDRKNTDIRTETPSTINGNESKQDTHNVENDCWTPAVLAIHPSENECSDGNELPASNESPGRDDGQSSGGHSDVAFRPLVVIFEMAAARNPDLSPDEGSLEELQLEVVDPDVYPEESDDAQLLAEPHTADDGPDHKKVVMRLVEVPKSASTPLLCPLCPRPTRRFALTSAAEMMPVCFKLVSPYERWPRTTYTLANVTP